MRRAAIVGFVLVLAGVAAAEVPSPEELFGRAPGEDRYLVPWEQVEAYMHAAAEGSERVSIESAGRSTQGRDIPVVIVTSEANQQRLDRYREIARRLANPDRLSAAERERLIREGRLIVLITCTIHSTEVGSTQMAPGLVHELATSNDPEVRRWLDEAIVLLMPSINPDGQVLVVDWYNQWLGTRYEGGPMPWLYHEYVGHDTNRDFYMLTQAETRAVNHVLYHRWFPQVFLDEHQMGSTGPRMFVPPQTDPLAPEVHSLIFRQADLLGTHMALRMEEAGKRGVGSNMIFDSYWPGGTRNTAWWKNVTGLLMEVASARLASPILIDPGELRGGSKGFPKYQRRANFPSPWQGGWWRLSDIVGYMKVATRALIEAGASRREGILRNFVRMGLDAASNDEATWVIPVAQHDPVAAVQLVELLLEHGVRVERALGPVNAGSARYAAGSYLVSSAQPYGAFAATMLRPHRYPEVLVTPDGPIVSPYDATTWSLPLLMGARVAEHASVETGTRPLGSVEWPKSPRTGSGTGGWLISRSVATATALGNSLLSEGHDLYWLANGDLWVPPDGLNARAIRRAADELHCPVVPIPRRPSSARALRVRPARVGLYAPWVASIDEGWTRWVLEQHGFEVTQLRNAAFASDSWGDEVDVLLLPSIDPDIIRNGEPPPERRRYSRGPLPPDYQGGIGGAGGSSIAEWVRSGGTAVAMGRSADYLIKLLELPVVNVLHNLDPGELSCPGSLLRVDLDDDHPLAAGANPTEAIYWRSSAVFRTHVPDPRFDRRVVARYPDDRRDILISGYLSGAKHLERRAALVELKVGDGRVVLFGFRPQHRGQTVRTFRLLFNALWLANTEAVRIQ
jgi:hypothetical protein